MKTVAINSDSVISLVRVNGISEFHLTTNGSSVVKIVSVDDMVVEDFVLNNTTHKIYFCGHLSKGDIGVFGGGIYYSSLFSTLSVSCQMVAVPSTSNVKKIDAYSVGVSAFVSLLTEDNKYMYTLYPVLGYPLKVNSFKAPDNWHLINLTHTKDYVVIIGSAGSGDKLVLYRHLKNFPSSVTIPPTPTFYTLNFCTYTLSDFMINYGEYDCHLVSIDSVNTNDIVVGLSTSSSNDTKNIFTSINMNTFDIYTNQEIVYSYGGRPDIMDIQYNLSADKLLCLGSNLDDDDDIVYSIKPFATSSYTTNFVFPNANSMYEHVRWIQKSLSIYHSDYYLVLGDYAHTDVLFFDKRLNVFDGNCFETTSHGVQINPQSVVKDTKGFTFLGETSVKYCGIKFF